MKETVKKHRRKEQCYRIQPVYLLILVVSITGLLAMGIRMWREYRDTLIENQKEQMLITAQALGKNLSISLNDYEDDLELLTQIQEAGNGNGAFYHRFLDSQGRFEVDILWEDSQGKITDSVKGLKLTEPVLITRTGEDSSIWQCGDEEGGSYLLFKRRLEDGSYLCLAVDGETYYEEMISDIQVGTNGYVMLKNSEGRIVMHPQHEQWGIDVIEGRREMYPELDYSSLEEMVEEQISGKSGISEYYSYWWTMEELPRVKKVSAYAPAGIGDDYWVVSVVIDYDDLYLPVAEGIQNLTLTFGAGLLIVVLFSLYIGKLLSDRRRADSEISYLRELNQVLEEMHRSEETVAHQQRLQIMGTMTGGIAHEFNNFLTPIMGYAELLMMELPEESDAYDSAREIYEASEKAKDVIRQISSMSRKNVETVYKSIGCEKLITRAVKLVESICPPNIRLEKDIEHREMYILGNATQLNQVFLNICANAIHAMGRKEGVLQVSSRCQSKEILKQYLEEETGNMWEEYLHISIRDSGCGMDKDTLEQIFEPFFTTKKSGEGTGLGLALAEQIVRSHKGYICAESQPGEGSTFHIFLPAAEKMKEEVKAEAGIGAESGIDFVIADDNAKILELLRKNMEKRNISVRTAGSREELEERLQAQEARVLLVDESLGSGRGIDCCMAMEGRYPDMLKILMVSRVTREVIEAKQRDIIYAYIEKPVSVERVMETIHDPGK